jgi:cytochrome c
MSRLTLLLIMALLANARVASASPQEDKEMNDLAKASGCYLCHKLEPRKRGAQELLPYGPAWKDIANKYRGQADAADRLTRTVLQGSGSSVAERHWYGKAEGPSMVPNRVEISEPDARRLVIWILSLSAPASSK